MPEQRLIYGPGLSADGLYDRIIASKHKEILSPNLSLTYRLPGVDGSAVQSWDGAQVFSFPSFFTTGPGARYVQELNGLLYVGGRSISCDNMARWDGGA